MNPAYGKGSFPASNRETFINIAYIPDTTIIKLTKATHLLFIGNSPLKRLPWYGGLIMNGAIVSGWKTGINIIL